MPAGKASIMLLLIHYLLLLPMFVGFVTGPCLQCSS